MPVKKQKPTIRIYHKPENLAYYFEHISGIIERKKHVYYVAKIEVSGIRRHAVIYKRNYVDHTQFMLI